MFLNDRDKWNVLTDPLARCVAQFLEIVAAQHVATGVSDFEVGRFAAAVTLYRHVANAIRPFLQPALAVLSKTTKDTSESMWSHQMFHALQKQEGCAIPPDAIYKPDGSITLADGSDLPPECVLGEPLPLRLTDENITRDVQENGVTKEQWSRG